MSLTRTVDLVKLNSMTKYPSIFTYHVLGERGKFTDAFLELEELEPVLVTEKVDGTNVRILFMPDGEYIIGSREEFLYASGDLIGNPSLGIVDAVKPIAERLKIMFGAANFIFVLYGELYGYKIGSASKQYTTGQEVAFRMFDLMQLPTHQFDALYELEAKNISTWRESGGQPFVDERTLQAFSTTYNIPLTPRLASVLDFPKTIEGVYTFLKHVMPETKVALTEDAPGKPEGIVIRTASRGYIAKIRYEDYERTLKGKK